MWTHSLSRLRGEHWRPACRENCGDIARFRKRRDNVRKAPERQIERLLYAVRRELLVPVPEGTILDDVYIPMQVVRQKKRVA